MADEAAMGLYGLTKRFGTTVAVDEVRLEVPRGSFLSRCGGL
ncbi:ABC-2 type transport system ATP-binding protein [Amycolatopsis sulphurea]|uniref:ABC-2 type transport system ATP-binding protein n=1 Tax=Amycolatopsis sulphurea TaxID=76022 RepID=A0A2A9FFC2_9PSEU|nr:hypothetical protein [Amycolatopsis sulphurea]PFG50074.1 ABC-2 type transport system ATP-binding protein [Amycolatopsis sulphurea]